MLAPRLRDYFGLTSQQETISEELQTIPSASPYVVDLNQLPKIRTGATSIIGNVWLSVADATTLVTVEIETSPSTWEVATLTESSSPAALEVYFQLASPTLFPYSPRLGFNVAHSGQEMRIAYTGFGSVPLARYFTQLYDIDALIQLAALPAMIDMEVYNSGRLDGYGSASKEVEVTASNAMIVGTDGSNAPFPGITLDFDLGGNAVVGGFTTTLYWKRILIYLDVSGVSWTVTTSESAEQSARANLDTPVIDTSKTMLGYIDVQNSGTTGVAGEIDSIESDNIINMVLLADGSLPFLGEPIIIETDSDITLTAYQLESDVVVETLTNTVNIYLPAISEITAGNSARLIVVTRSANAFTVIPSGTNMMTLVATAENKKLVSPSAAYSTAIIVLASTTSGWFIISAKNGASMGTTGFTLVVI